MATSLCKRRGSWRIISLSRNENFDNIWRFRKNALTLRQRIEHFAPEN